MWVRRARAHTHTICRLLKNTRPPPLREWWRCFHTYCRHYTYAALKSTTKTATTTCERRPYRLEWIWIFTIIASDAEYWWRASVCVCEWQRNGMNFSLAGYSLCHMLNVCALCVCKTFSRRKLTLVRGGDDGDRMWVFCVKLVQYTSRNGFVWVRVSLSLSLCLSVACGNFQSCDGIFNHTMPFNCSFYHIDQRLSHLIEMMCALTLLQFCQTVHNLFDKCNCHHRIEIEIQLATLIKRRTKDLFFSISYRSIHEY